MIGQDINMQGKISLPSHWRGEFFALMGLGLPMALTQLIQFSIYTVDTIMLGRVGPEDLAAGAIGSVVYFFLWMLAAGPVMAVTPLVSQALGANQNNYQDARRSVRMALWVIFLMTPFIFLLLIFTEEIALALGQSPVLAHKAEDYVLALSLGLPFAMAVMALRNFLATLGKTLIPLLLVAITTLLNAGLNYIFIFGKFGAPRLELVGAGLASTLATMIGFFLFVIYIHRDRHARRFDIFKRLYKLDLPRLKEVIRLGWPISVSVIFEGMLFNAAIFLVGLIGVIEVAAYQIGLNVVTMAFMLPWGLSMAGAVRIGLSAGAKNISAVRRAALVCMVSATLGMSMIALFVALRPEFIAGIYIETENPENHILLGWVVGFLPIACAFMVFDAMQVACNQLLRGLKDVTYPMFATALSFWGVGFSFAYILSQHTSLGAYGVWYGLMSGLIMAAFLLGLRLYYLVWGQKEPDVWLESLATLTSDTTNPEALNSKT